MHPARSLAVLTVATLLTATTIDARPWRPAQVPNGSQIGCILCHMSPGGGDARNAFGLEIENGFLDGSNVAWGPDLAALDSDGDGATNGQELLDPDGVWTIGDDNPGDFSAVTLPGDEDSVPPPPDNTAVAASTWAKVKTALRDLLD